VKTPTILATMTIGVVTALSAAAPAQASPWEFAGAYPTEAECVSAGDQGLATGEWQDYQCALFEGVHDLYVRVE
jgi:hypothetical protein